MPRYTLRTEVEISIRGKDPLDAAQRLRLLVGCPITTWDFIHDEDTKQEYIEAYINRIRKVQPIGDGPDLEHQSG